MNIYIQQLENGLGLPLPTQGTPLSAGFDLCAANLDNVILKPGQRVLVDCGFIMAMPAGFEAQIRPRSGLALKHGVTVLNAPGTIDADYRGEVKVLLINHSDQDFIIERGMRIAQMVIAVVSKPDIIKVDELPALETDTIRKAGGFGSTGLN